MERKDLIVSVCSKLTKHFKGIARFLYLSDSYLDCEKILVEKLNGVESVIDITSLTNADAISKIVESVQVL